MALGTPRMSGLSQKLRVQPLRMNWQPIETAPRDGTIVLSVWDRTPVFVSYTVGIPPVFRTRRRLFRSPVTEIDRPAIPGGWRVLAWGPRTGWGIHGNCEPFEPAVWADLRE